MQNAAEAQLAVTHGASALGFVSAMPSGPGPISEELIAEIVPTVPAGVATFLLTSKRDTDSIIDQQRRTRTTTLQIVDEVSFDTLNELRDALPGIALVQVIHVRNEDSIREAVAVAPFIDALLLDSGNPSLPVKVLGGTGKTHDWKLSHRIVQESGKPVFLAGGLKAENVRLAIEEVQPFGVDVCSGVRTNGALDTGKLARFMEEARSTPR